MSKLKLISTVLLTTILMTACEDSEEGKLDNRVKAFWDAKINKDFKIAYQYLSPGWRENESEETYILRMSGGKVKWLNANLLKKKCSQKDICEIKIGIDYEYQFRGVVSEKMKVSSSLKENWIMKNNVWYNLPIQKKLL